MLDSRVSGNDQPSQDSTSPASLSGIKVTKNSTMLIAEFTRNVVSSKATRDYTISLTSAMTMIWATHASRPISGFGSVAKHQYDGSITVSFGGSQPCDAAASTGTTYTSPGGDFRLAWALSPDSTSMTFTMEATSTGWISFGFGTTGTMAGSDMYVGWVTSGGVATVSDAYSIGQSLPQPDTSQGGTTDVTAVTGSVVRVWEGEWKGMGRTGGRGRVAYERRGGRVCRGPGLSHPPTHLSPQPGPPKPPAHSTANPERAFNACNAFPM